MLCIKLVFTLITLVMLTGCGIQHSVYVKWKNEDSPAFKKDSYLCMQFSKYEFDRSSANWAAGYTEVMFIDIANDISKKSAAKEYYKCMDSNGHKIQSQLVNTNSNKHDISAVFDVIKSCEAHFTNESDQLVCLNKAGWHYIDNEPWIYEYDTNSEVVEKCSGHDRSILSKADKVQNSGKQDNEAHLDAMTITGTWQGKYNNSKGKDGYLKLQLNQAGDNVLGQFASSSGSNGDIKGIIRGNLLNFKITITTAGCSGSFDGTGTVSNQGNASIMSFSYSGAANDICGGRESGTGNLTKFTAY